MGFDSIAIVIKFVHLVSKNEPDSTITRFQKPVRESQRLCLYCNPEQLKTTHCRLLTSRQTFAANAQFEAALYIKPKA
jgi:hypothetical protein